MYNSHNNPIERILMNSQPHLYRSLLLTLLLFLLAGASTSEARSNSSFDHFSTGFALDGVR